MACWILKTEPSTYGYADLERDGTAVWDGVKNALALRHLRAMAKDDRVIVYHSGKDKAAVGLAVVVRAAYPDPKLEDDALVVVDLQAAGRLAAPVPLAAIRKEQAFADLALVRMPRLSVMPCTESQYNRILAMGE